MISRERLTDYVQELIKIDSISKKEKDVALRLKKDMEDLGAECFFDGAGDKVGGNTGNLIVRVKGNVNSKSPLLLSSHMDTVEPGEGIKPIIDNGIMRSDGSTILGSDDKSGLAIIVEVIRTLKEHNIPHPDIEIAFTICEEIGLLGAKFIDASHFRAESGIVLDSSTPDRLVLKCPSSDKITVEITGYEAHAGLCPENGINAIKIASEAIASMKVGRIDDETTSNIGIIEGGWAVNTVPGFVRVSGEARSHDDDKLDKQIKHMIGCFFEASSRYTLNLEGKTITPEVNTSVQRIYHRMDVPADAPITKIVDSAVENLGYKIKHHTSGGGCDANYFNYKGIQCVNLGTGMYDLHTKNEYLVLDEFYRSAEILLESIKLYSAKSNL